MHQDTFFYHNFPQDPRLQYPNVSPFPSQPNTAPWSGSYIPPEVLRQAQAQAQDVQNPFNFGNQLQPPCVAPVPDSAYGTSPTLSWAHTVPNLMPWMTQDEANVPDPIIRFSAPFPPDPCTSQTATSWELLNNLGANKTNVNMHLKRKNELDALELTAPQKLCITEEKMAARLKELHISNQYSVPAQSSPFGPYGNSLSSGLPEKSVTNLRDLEAMLKDSSSDDGISTKSLILAPEIKKLVEPEKIFARTFIDKVERPSMAVVVWQPQNKLMANANNNCGDSKTEGEKESSNSNISLTKGNNNFLCQQLSAICNQNSFTIARSTESSSSANSEDIMDT